LLCRLTPSEQLHTLPVTVPNLDETPALSTLEEPSAPNSFREPESPDPNNPPWGIGGALLVWVASIVLIVLMPVVFFLPYAWSKGFHSGMPNYAQALTEFALSDKTAVILQVVSLIPSHLLTLILVWAVVTRFGKKPFWAAIGWGWPQNLPWPLGLMISAGLGVVLFMIGGFIAWLFGAEKPTQLEQIINSSLAARYLISFLAVFTAPFVEEFVYRGVLFSALQREVGLIVTRIMAFAFGVELDSKSRNRVGVWAAVVMVLALFTIIHVPQYWPNFGVIAAVALLSIVLTLVRAYSGRLLPCIVIHLVFNGIQAIILLIEPHIKPLIPSAERAAPTAAFLRALVGFII
jgi:membrane protease YdiL (CAAX protease family)